MTINPWDIFTKIDRLSTGQICVILSLFLLLENILDKAS